jgi:hypothetical protein
MLPRTGWTFPAGPRICDHGVVIDLSHMTESWVDPWA